MKVASPKFERAYRVVVAPGGFVRVATLRRTRKEAVGRLVEMRNGWSSIDRDWPNCRRMGYRVVKVRVSPAEGPSR